MAFTRPFGDGEVEQVLATAEWLQAWCSASEQYPYTTFSADSQVGAWIRGKGGLDIAWYQTRLSLLYLHEKWQVVRGMLYG